MLEITLSWVLRHTGDIDLLKEVLEHGGDPNYSRFDSYYTSERPLHKAVKAHNLACVKVLLKGGAFVNTKYIHK